VPKLVGEIYRDRGIAWNIFYWLIKANKVNCSLKIGEKCVEAAFIHGKWLLRCELRRVGNGNGNGNGNL
jgi:hypothetical protein